MDPFHVFVGSQNGYLKGFSLKTGQWENIATSTKNNDIVSMCWNDGQEQEVCVGTVKQEIKLFDQTGFYVTHDLSDGDNAQLVGLCKFDSNFLMCTDGGTLKILSRDFIKQTTKDLGPKICFLKQNQESANLIATGGQENELKIWDVNSSLSNIFTAKNVKNDWLDLRVPVWVLSAAFVPKSDKIFTSTSYHQVRLYDPKCQKRPVMEAKFEECPLSCISVANDNMQVVVGSSQGHLGLLDFRGKSGHIVHKFKGPTGAVKSVECIPSMNLFACCGLDRFLRIYNITDKSLVYKSFMKAKLNCLLLKSSIEVDLKNLTSVNSLEIKSKSEDNKDIESDSDIWTEMKVVHDDKELKTAAKRKSEDLSHKPTKIKC